MTREGKLCAICNRTNQTLRLCQNCKRDSANQGWSQGSRREILVDTQILPLVASCPAPTGRRLRPASRRTQQIFDLVREYSICVPLRNFGARRVHEPWVWRSRPLNLSEIAFLVGCSRQAVLKAVRNTLELSTVQRA